MGFTTLDAVIVVVYALASAALGAWIGRKQTSTTDYFLGGRSLPWPAVAFSVVATETSVLTFIGIPASSYLGDCTFLQIAAGYVVGRFLVAAVFLPKYFAGKMETAYQFLGHRFGQAMRNTTSITFMITRVLADGVRLFATAIPLALIIKGSDAFPEMSDRSFYLLAIVVIGLLTMAYTYVGGIRAVVWMDVIQMAIYMGGAVVAVFLIQDRLADGFGSVLAAAEPGDKLRVLYAGTDLSFAAFIQAPYTFFVALLGGAVFSVASHGTDQLIVQRLLTCRTQRAGQIAIVVSGFAVLAQFALFLWLGAMLFAFYGGETPAALGLKTANDIFPEFILNEMPSGLSGLVVAALFAAAMSTLSSTLSSLSSATMLDVYRPLAGAAKSDAALLRGSRLATLVWGVVLIGVATAFTGLEQSVVDTALGIASYTYGALLGVFLLGLIAPRARQRDAIPAFLAALVMNAILIQSVNIAWPLYTLAGSLTALLVGIASSRFGPRTPTGLAGVGLLLALGAGCASPRAGGPASDAEDKSVRLHCGLDVLVEDDCALLRGKRVGVITNHTARTTDGRHVADVLHAHPGVRLAALFGPEHGVRGATPGGHKVASSTDPKTGVPIFSLYGKTRKPTAEMLSALDVLVFDIQDVGARFYTYVYTMANAMEAAAEHGKTFVVLDRPNPIGGVAVEGPVLLPGYESFVGMFPLPVRHGLTVGELARLFVERGWIAEGRALDLVVVPVRGWSRADWYDDTDLAWIAPSPNMRTLATATVYPGTCLFEGTNVSEGRGTHHPFEWIGAPWVDRGALAIALEGLGLPGVRFHQITFTPVPIPPSVPRPKHRDAPCHGVAIEVTDRRAFQSVKTGIAILWHIARRHPEAFEWRRSIDRLFGSDRLRRWVDAGVPLEEIFTVCDLEAEEARAARESVLLYR